MDVVIREIQAADKAQWRTLWNGYNQFYASTVSEAITEKTWQRILDERSSIYGRVAVVNGDVQGFAHIVLHEGTWVIAPICYLEDLFVAPETRGRGLARKLIQSLVDEGKAEGWSRLYWHTRESNPARKLYDQFTDVEDFVLYRMNL
ncbi:GNAT family N-acetyltransferase [Scandinavium sp.]|uniref:GNAT family N-acetyltransferase n=1 Tax=Scandinavium sp. TaxID=2830653 RepID=UPI00289E88F3|nr:GNAT family N-acetyltransferase [Scandinavium sp.]